MWTLDMKFNADKGLGWSIKLISKLEIMEYLHIRIQCAFFQICKSCAQTESVRPLANSRTHTSLSKICKKGEICCPNQKMQEQQQVYCTSQYILV